jgi:transcriptional regulator with XRE-family HTH domain
MELDVRRGIGKRLQEARERAKMSQEDVKEALGLAAGRRFPSGSGARRCPALTLGRS